MTFVSSQAGKEKNVGFGNAIFGFAAERIDVGHIIFRVDVGFDIVYAGCSLYEIKKLINHLINDVVAHDVTNLVR